MPLDEFTKVERVRFVTIQGVSGGIVFPHYAISSAAVCRSAFQLLKMKLLVTKRFTARFSSGLESEAWEHNNLRQRSHGGGPRLQSGFSVFARPSEATRMNAVCVCRAADAQTGEGEKKKKKKRSIVRHRNAKCLQMISRLGRNHHFQGNSFTPEPL